MIIPIQNIGSLGIVKDLAPHKLPMEAWTDGQNFRFLDDNCARSLGQTQVFGTPSIVPGFIMNVPSPASSFWFYLSKTAAYVYDAGVHTNVTRLSGAYTAQEYRQWNGSLLAGIPIFNNGIDKPQYWASLSVGTKLADLSNWTATLRAKIIRAYGPFLVALNLSDNGTLLPQSLQWSHPADPGTVPASWDYADPTVDAGRIHLTDVKGGEIHDALLLQDNLVIYKANSTHLLRFVGGSSIMSPNLLRLSGILAPRCAAVIDSGTKHFVVSQDNVLIHAGSPTVAYPLEAKDKRYLFADMDSTNYLNAFAYDDPTFNEACFAYPSSGQEFPNKELFFNYKTGQVGFRDFDGTTVDTGDYTDSTGTAWNDLSGSWDSQVAQWSTAARRKLLYGAPSLTKIFAKNEGYPFGASTPTCFLERTGLVLAKDGVHYTKRKLVKRIWIRWRGSAQLSVRVGAQEELDDAIVWQSPKIFDPTQKYLDFEAVGRLPAVRFSTSDNLPGQLEGYDLEFEEISDL